MEFDFLEEAKKQKEAMIKDLVKIIKCESVNEVYDPKNKQAPFGENLKTLLGVMMNLARSNDFYALNCDNYAMHIQLGNYKDYVAILGHLDVVPAGSNWSYPPFDGIVSNNKVYGRGAIDNKGGIIASFYAMKILNELNIKLSKSVRLILGLDEETNWHSLEYYFKRFPQIPVGGFVPDASFPVIYAEKGILSLAFSNTIADDFIVSFEAGVKDNIVCDKASVVISNTDYQHSFQEYLLENNLKGTSQIIDNQLHLTIYGLAAHASNPTAGKNAIFLLINYLNSLNIASPFIQTMNEYFTDDYRGEKLNINHYHLEMQELTTNCAIVNYLNNKLYVVVNIRYVKDMEYDSLMHNIKKRIDNFFDIEELNHLNLLYQNPNSELITTLEAVYQKYTNDYVNEKRTIGGGTYARTIKNVCAFGMQFPGREEVAHMADEYVDIDDLVLACAIYAEAIYHLAK